MKKNELINQGYSKIANICAIMAIPALSIPFIIEVIFSGRGISIGLIGLCIAAALVAVISATVSTVTFSSLGFYIPVVLFTFYTVLMVMDNWQSSNYMLVCLCFCGISCMYSDLRKTVLFVILQYIVIGVLIFRGTPVIGHDEPLSMVLSTWFFSIFGVLALILLTSSATVVLNRVIDEVNSFRNLLTTTENYVAMLDKLNRVVYVSKPLSRLTKIEDPELTKGRPIIDLFPGRELKLLTAKMLKEKEKYAEDWEFTLDGQKRYFRVTSNDVIGTAEGTLVNLHDMTHLAERDEIAVMKDSLKIGFFFMDRQYIIQDHYSRFLEEMLSETDLAGRCFTDLLTTSVGAKDLEAIQDYFNMIFERTFDQDTLDEINPLSQINYVDIKTGSKKVFQCDFTTVDRGRGEIFVLVTIYDITARIELQQQLREEEAKRQEEMQSIFELIQVDPNVFTDFLGDVEHEFDKIDQTLKNTAISAHEALVEVYQSVHAIKSNAVILGLSIFGKKVHNLESKIKILREQEEVPFSDMLGLTMDLEKLSQEKEGFKATIEKVRTLTGGASSDEGRRQGQHVLIESLVKTANKAAADMEKKVEFIVESIDSEVIEKSPRRVMKEVLMQLIRNSVAHGIETPEVRLANGKNETGIIRLSIKHSGEKIHVRLGDDGKGLDFEKIRERAEQLNLIRKEDGDNRDLLLKTIFAPGFSTSETEGMHAGRGIGLNLVRDRIREVKGSIKLQTEPGKGTVFNIFIPIEKNNEMAAKAS